MSDSPDTQKKQRRGVYLLPNLFTTASLFAGFYAIIAAIKGDFELAASVVFIAMVLDGADGRIARLTNTQSAFGAEYDSLSDVIAFGLAPAIIVYLWSGWRPSSTPPPPRCAWPASTRSSASPTSATSRASPARWPPPWSPA